MNIGVILTLSRLLEHDIFSKHVSHLLLLGSLTRRLCGSQAILCHCGYVLHAFAVCRFHCFWTSARLFKKHLVVDRNDLQWEIDSATIIYIGKHSATIIIFECNHNLLNIINYWYNNIVIIIIIIIYIILFFPIIFS